MTAAGWARSPEPRVWIAGAPDGRLLVVTRLGRATWVPAITAPDGGTSWHGQPCRIWLAAPESAEGEAAA